MSDRSSVRWLSFSPSCAELGSSPSPALSHLTGDRRPLGFLTRHPGGRRGPGAGQLLPPCGPGAAPALGEATVPTQLLPSCCQGDPSGWAGPGFVSGGLSR